MTFPRCGIQLAFPLLAALACVHVTSQQAPSPAPALAPGTWPRVVTSFGTAELTRAGDEVRLTLLDGSGQPLPLGASTAVLTPRLGDQPVTLSAKGGTLAGALPAGADLGASPLAVLWRDGRTEILGFGAAGPQAALPPRLPGEPIEELRASVISCDDPASQPRCSGARGLRLIAEPGPRLWRALAPSGASLDALLAQHVAGKLVVRGLRHRLGAEEVFAIHEIYPEHDHTPLHGGLVGMAGDIHVEVVPLRTGEIRIYLTDPYRRPVTHFGLTGVVEVADLAGVSLGGARLQPDAQDRFLLGIVMPLPNVPVEVTTKLDAGPLSKVHKVPLAERDTFYMISFVIEPANAPAVP